MYYESGGVPEPRRHMRDMMNKCDCGKIWVGPFRAKCSECSANDVVIEHLREVTNEVREANDKAETK